MVEFSDLAHRHPEPAPAQLAADPYQAGSRRRSRFPREAPARVGVGAARRSPADGGRGRDRRLGRSAVAASKPGPDDLPSGPRAGPGFGATVERRGGHGAGILGGSRRRAIDGRSDFTAGAFGQRPEMAAPLGRDDRDGGDPRGPGAAPDLPPAGCRYGSSRGLVRLPAHRPRRCWCSPPVSCSWRLLGKRHGGSDAGGDKWPMPLRHRVWSRNSPRSLNSREHREYH